MDKQDLIRIIFSSIDNGDGSEALSYLLSDKKLFHQELPPFGSWLHIAARTGNIKVVKSLIENGFKINTKSGNYKLTALAAAASFGKADIVEYLLNQGATFDLESSITNPLFAAISGNYKNVVKLLIEYKIDSTVSYNTDTMNNKTALMFAKEMGFKEIENLLSKNKQEMQNKVLEESLNELDTKAIHQVVLHAKKLLNILNLNEVQDIPHKIQSLVENANTLQANDFFALGALWAEIIIKEKNWKWVKVESEDWASTGIVDKERKFLVFPLSFIKQNNTDTLLLYNSIIESNLPVSSKGNYLILA